MARLTPEERAIHAKASAALGELLAQWQATGVPAHGQTGMLLAAFVEVSLRQRGMTFSEMVADIIDCLQTLRDKSN